MPTSYFRRTNGWPWHGRTRTSNTLVAIQTGLIIWLHLPISLGLRNPRNQTKSPIVKPACGFRCSCRLLLFGESSGGVQTVRGAHYRMKLVRPSAKSVRVAGTSVAVHLVAERSLGLYSHAAMESGNFRT